jgi:hypothetical protein
MHAQHTNLESPIYALKVQGEFPDDGYTVQAHKTGDSVLESPVRSPDRGPKDGIQKQTSSHTDI